MWEEETQEENSYYKKDNIVMLKKEDGTFEAQDFNKVATFTSSRMRPEDVNYKLFSYGVLSSDNRSELLL